jgi:hypothetical protein
MSETSALLSLTRSVVNGLSVDMQPSRTQRPSCTDKAPVLVSEAATTSRTFSLNPDILAAR